MASYDKKHLKKRQKKIDKERESESFVEQKKREKRLTFLSIFIVGLYIAVIYLYINKDDYIEGVKEYTNAIRENVNSKSREDSINSLMNNVVNRVFDTDSDDTESITKVLGNPENSLLINDSEKQNLDNIDKMIQEEFDKYLD